MALPQSPVRSSDENTFETPQTPISLVSRSLGSPVLHTPSLHNSNGERTRLSNYVAQTPMMELEASSRSAVTAEAQQAMLLSPMREEAHFDSGSMIWGTNIDIQDVADRFRAFLHEFTFDDSKSDGGVMESKDNASSDYYYMSKLREMSVSGINWLDIDGEHFHLHPLTSMLFPSQISHYPDEMLSIFSLVTTEEFQIMHHDDPGLCESFSVSIHLTSLPKRQSAVPINEPNCLVKIRGMVTHVTKPQPILTISVWICDVCKFSLSHKHTDGNHKSYPKSCPQCRSNSSLSFQRNLSQYVDSQTILVQDHIAASSSIQTAVATVWLGINRFIDYIHAGQEVDIIGIRRLWPVFATRSKSHKTLKSVFKTMIEANYVMKTNSGIESNEVDFSQTDVDKFHAFAEESLAIPRLVSLFAPSVWGMDDTKKGILCMLFGGTRTKSTRSNIHVLLCGDPGTSKSQLLTYVSKPNNFYFSSLYLNGRLCSLSGLLVSVGGSSSSASSGGSKRQLGAFLRCQVACMDELDKMNENIKTSALNEIMENQTVSMAKAGCVCRYQSNISILASANPVQSRWNPRLSIIANLKMNPTLLSRFDLIYLILDKPDAISDRSLARHILSLYAAQTSQDMNDEDFLKKYIHYAQKKIFPRISSTVKEYIAQKFMELRRAGKSENVISATFRQLESIIRLSEALAKMKLSTLVTQPEVDEAFDLMSRATQAAAIDPRTGRIDMDLIATGRTTSDIKLLRILADKVLETVQKIASSKSGGRDGTEHIHLSAIKGCMSEDGVDAEYGEFMGAIKSLASESRLQFNEKALTVSIREKMEIE